MICPHVGGAAPHFAALITSTFVYDVYERLPPVEAAEVFREERDERCPIILQRARRVRRDDDVWQIPIRAGCIERLLREHVERRAAEPPVPQRADHRGIIDQLAPRDVDQERAALDAVRLRTSDPAPGP